MNDIAAYSIIIPIVIWALSLLILYAIIRVAIVHALRRARREAYTEDHAPELAEWLSSQQRTELAEYRARRASR